MKKYIKPLIILFCVAIFLTTICFIPIRVSKLIPFIEEQVAEDLGVNIHIERLILRLGPSLKFKAPMMHVTYQDGQKFAQFDNVKFYVPWMSLLKEKPVLSSIKARKLTIRILSDDQYLEDFIKKLNNKKYNESPSISLSEYSFSYFNKNNNDRYVLKGQNFELKKKFKYRSYRLKTQGVFSINSQDYITYDLFIVPNFEINNLVKFNNFEKVIEQIKELDFHADVISDLKLYKDKDKIIQASGFINLDNISIFDKTKKLPKSFIYLTLWGDKASVLSNIYTSMDKKVYIEGMVNNSKKPIVDFKVKTDDVDIKDLYDKIKIFTNFSIFKEINNIEGKLSANFSIKGDIKKVKSNGYLKISNAKIDTSTVTIDRINSDIDFSNNVININKAVGLINEAPIIAKGKIDKTLDLQLIMNKIELKHLFPEKYGIKTGLISLIADIKGTFDKVNINENLLIENLNIKRDDFDFYLDSLKYDTYKSDIAFFNNILCKTKYASLIKIPSLKMDIKEEFIKIPETNVFLPNSKLIMKADILDYKNNGINFVSSLSGSINSKDIALISDEKAIYPLKVTINGNKTSQNIIAQFLIQKTNIFDEPTLVSLISKLENKNLKIEDLSLSTLQGDFINDFKQSAKTNKKLVISGLLENVYEPVFKNIRIFIPQQLNLNFGDTILQLKGDLFLNGKVTSPEIIGQLTVQNLLNSLMQISITNATLDFNKTNLILNAPQVKIIDSVLAVNALISTAISDAITVKNINVKSKYVNTDTFLMHKDNPILKIHPIQIKDGKFYAERLETDLYNSKLYLTAFTSDLNLNDNILAFKNISTELYNGKLTGEIKYNLKDEQFESNVMARGVSAEPIFRLISHRDDSISGTMDFDSKINGNITSKEALNGNIKFIINNGRLSTLGKLEHLLYAQNVIADNMLRTSLSVVTKAITLKDTGLFKYLRGDVDLLDGIANINLLQSQGPHMSLFMKGKLNTINNYANLTILGRISDEVVTGLGAFADFSLNKLMVMLTGEETRWNIIPADFENIPPLSAKNTKEFRSIINGIVDKPSSVVLFNWISYSQKSLKQKDVPLNNVKVPDFIEKIPY